MSVKGCEVQAKIKYQFEVSAKQYAELMRACKKVGNTELYEHLEYCRKNSAKALFKMYLEAGIIEKDNE